MAKTRTEIDKDMMYRKIMPSAVKKDGGDQKGTAADGVPGMERPGEPGADGQGASADAESSDNTAAGNQPYSLPTAASMAKALKRNPVSLPFKEENNMVLVNLMEELVISRLDSTLDRFNCCKCDKCKKDIASLALNRLKPRYVVMREGDQEKRGKAEQENGQEVTGALVQAILVVEKNPLH